MARVMITSLLSDHNKNLFRVNHQRTGAMIIILLLTFLQVPALAFDFEKCESCHGVKLDQERIRYYLHSPFSQWQCGQCHAATVAPRKSVKGKAKKAVATGWVDRRKVDWLGDSVMADTSHAFVLPSDKMGKTLVVEAQGTDGSFTRKEFAVPLLDNLVEVEDYGLPPVLSGVKVLNVQRGVFLTVTIGWQTDSLTDALVRYGEKDLNQTSEPVRRFGHRHQVVLHRLQPDKTYQFEVVSQDLFGRSQASATGTFSTARPLTKGLPDDHQGQSRSSENENEPTSSFQRLGKNYLLEVTLRQPASIYVGSKGKVRRQNLTAATRAGNADVNEPHIGLSSEDVSSMDACRNCHQNQDTATHPVNVYPKPGMTIPPEYPTLPDGRITCRSCHETHSADYEFLVRKQGKRELCVGCHQDML